MRQQHRAARRDRVWLLLPALVALASPRMAEATSCGKQVSEHFDIELVGVFTGKDAVRGPAPVRTLDELLGGGQRLLLWQKATIGFAKFYQLTRTIVPTPEVKRFIETTRVRKLRTGCGYSVPYAPILPGEYVFKEEHLDGATVSVGIDKPSLTISADRKQIELRFIFAGEQQRALYKVKRASFP
jgi:hypothetical protein